MKQKKKILIIDDDPGIQDAFRMIFEQAGYDTDVHMNGTELLKGNYLLPDLFILDKQLPGVDGLDVCRHLKAQEKSRHIPVMILSASPQLEGISIVAGADCFMEKPVRMNDLLRRVTDVLAAGTGNASVRNRA